MQAQLTIRAMAVRQLTDLQDKIAKTAAEVNIDRSSDRSIMEEMWRNVPKDIDEDLVPLLSSPEVISAMAQMIRFTHDMMYELLSASCLLMVDGDISSDRFQKAMSQYLAVRTMMEMFERAKVEG